MLPMLETSERIKQLCNIEALEQIHNWNPKLSPDSIDPAAMAEARIVGNSLLAEGGAYRFERQWYAIQLRCTVAPDYESVQAFEFKTGDPIPEDEWESHNLIAEDIELD